MVDSQKFSKMLDQSSIDPIEVDKIYKALYQRQQLSPQYNSYIIDYLTNNKGDYLEIGCFNGAFIAQIAKKFPNKNIYGIDPFIADEHIKGHKPDNFMPDIKENLYKNIKDINNITFWESTTYNCLQKEKYKDLSNVSCILIDGSHRYKDIIVDIDFILNIKNKHEMLIIFDDMQVPDVIEAVMYFKTKLNIRIKASKRHKTTGEYFIISSYEKN